MAKLRRSLLFIPGGVEKMIRKAQDLTNADAIVLDLEDSVQPANKDGARAAVTRVLAEPWVVDRDVGVRINSLDTEWAIDDLRAVVPSRPSFLFVPKCESAIQIAFLEGALRVLAAPNPPPELIITLETARGILRAEELAGMSALVTGLVFGAADLMRNTGGESTLLLEELDYPRLHVVLAATAAGIASFDVAYYEELANLEALEAQSVRGRRMGFKGKCVIHPSHLPVVNRVFSPSPEAIAEAREVLAAYAEGAASGKGAIRVRNRMIDAPMVEQARRTVSLAADLERRSSSAD